MAATEPPPRYRLIGQRVPYIEGPLKVTGRAEYTDDIKRPGQLVGRLLRSPWPHARIRSIDVSRARAMPGVAAVLTGEKYPTPFGVLPITHDETAIAVGKVRYIGDIVAAVAAVDEATADRALQAIVVDFERLPDHTDPRTGTEKVTEQIHDRGLNGTNIQKEVLQHFGDVDAAFAQSHASVRVRGTFAGVTHAFTEPMATIAEATPDGRLTVWSATQVPHYLHRALSEVLGIPMHRIRVIKPEVGGGFGGKSDPLPHEIVCAALSIETGRPVKVLFDREDVFVTNHGRHPTQNDVRIAVDAEGKILAYDIDALIDGGAWSSFGTVTTYYNGVLSMGPYRVPELPVPRTAGLHDEAAERRDARPRRDQHPLLDRGRPRRARREARDRPVRPPGAERAPPELDHGEPVPDHVDLVREVPRARPGSGAGGTRSSGSSRTGRGWGSGAGSTSRGRTARSTSPRRCRSARST